MWRAPDHRRSSRSRGCPSPARCPTRRPPRLRARPGRPPAALTGAWPTAGSTTRAAVKQPLPGRSAVADTTSASAASCRDLALAGVRPQEVTARAVLHRFVGHLTGAGGHDRLSSVVPRDGSGWPDHPAGGPGPCTVNHHLPPVSGFLARVAARVCGGLPEGNPAAGVRTLVLPPLEPRALTPARVRCGAEVT